MNLHPFTSVSRRIHGFSLLEVLVATSIMALSLGALYQAAGGSVRSVQLADQRTQALLLAQSLLDAYDTVPVAGLSLEGSEGGLKWQLESAPYPTAFSQAPGWPLHHVEVTVTWASSASGRISLGTLLPVNANSLRVLQ